MKKLYLDQEILALREKGFSYRQIAERLKCSISFISGRMKVLGKSGPWKIGMQAKWDHPVLSQLQEKKKFDQLEAFLKVKIRFFQDRGYSIREVAQELGGSCEIILQFAKRHKLKFEGIRRTPLTRPTLYRWLDQLEDGETDIVIDELEDYLVSCSPSGKGSA